MWVPNIEFFLIAFEKKVEMCVFFGGEIPFGKSKISYAEMPCIRCNQSEISTKLMAWR